MTRFTTLSEPPRGVLRLSGPDARSFLQGLISNDVERVGPKRTIHAALLTPQGKYLFDFFVAEQGGALLIEAEAGRLDVLRRKLAMFRLRANVTIEHSDITTVLAFGSDAARSMGLDSPGETAPFADGLAFLDPRTPELGVRILTSAPSALLVPGFEAVPFERYDRLRLSLGIPDGTRDLVLEKSILLESGFDELHGIDWQKGCYVGQELTARTKYRGLVKKRLLPVRIEGPLPPSGTLLYAEGREAGEMRSGVSGLGLALIRLEALDRQEPLMSADGTRLYPQQPPWLKG